jgi:hypothetical protein
MIVKGVRSSVLMDHQLSLSHPLSDGTSSARLVNRVSNAQGPEPDVLHCGSGVVQVAATDSRRVVKKQKGRYQRIPSKYLSDGRLVLD